VKEESIMRTHLGTTLKKLALTCSGAILPVGTVASADNMDFTCNLGPTATCTGTLVLSASNYSTSGINVFNDKGPYDVSVPFVLSFNAAGAISIDGTGVDVGQNLVGHITGFSVGST
jgi:hypothetical protein